MLVQVRQRFYNHEDFMLELQSHQGAVRKVSVNKFILMILRDSSTVMMFQCTMFWSQVLDEGRRLAAASKPEQQQDIRVQMKLLSER